ncbi:hypothetical protein K6W36_12540 [Acetobacter senegalensis]|uniref:gp53-like domain-containing protein n=1 Tax=Acetobacter senegalensis TaxID=446692 RepID=UPI001EDABE9E|nr:hypothetical protein [Acetobacter senegalensis]MCG4261394.1 hypothetical protein [Acetobacter senegalensis]
MSDDDYANALATNGSFVKGVTTGQASAKQANKTWRQATLMAAAVAQIIADAGSDINDSLTQEAIASLLRVSLLSGYLPLAGGTLTGDTTIKGLASWSTTGNYTSNGLILSGQNGNIVTLRQNETTGKYTQLAIQVNGYNSSNGYFSLRNDGTFWSGTTQFADRTWVTNNFSDTFSSSGNDWFWMKFPSGVLIQGGNATYSASDGTTGTKVTLPTSFGAQFIIAVGNDIGSNANAVTVMRTDASTIHLLGREVTSGSLSDTVINYFCVGTAPS